MTNSVLLFCCQYTIFVQEASRACCSCNMPCEPVDALKVGFAARVEVLKSSCDGDRRLVVTHAENYHARDVISNKTIMCVMFDNKSARDVNAKKSWISAFQILDNLHAMSLSRAQNVKGQLCWAKVEQENLFGILNYFEEKLAKSPGSRNSDMADIKRCYFLTRRECAAAVAPEAIVAHRPGEDLAYPKSPSEEDGDGHLVAVKFPTAFLRKS